MENVEAEGGDKSITQCILLVQMSGIGTRFSVPPSSPFVKHKSHVLLRVVFIHNGAMLLDDIFYFAAFAQCPVIVVFAELGGGTFAAVPSADGIVVQGKTLHTAAYTVHQYFSPVIVVVAGTAGYLEEAIAVVVAAVGGIAAVEVGIIFGTHASTATPAFVSYTEVFHFPGLIATVLAAQACHGGVSFGGHVFYPFGKFFYGTTTYVSADIGLTTQHFAEIEELMGSETVVFDSASPVVVHHFGTVFFRADTVHPMVFVGKAAARPAKDRYAELFQCIEHVGAITVDIGNIGIFAYPKSAIDASSQMFCKLAVDFFGNDLLALVCV